MVLIEGSNWLFEEELADFIPLSVREYCSAC